MVNHCLLAIGLLLLVGYWAGRAANAVKLPRVTGYLIAGLLLGPSASGILCRSLVDQDLHSITELALSVIAYSIGGSLVYHRLKRLGRSILWITFAQGIGAFVLTTLVLLPALPVLSVLGRGGFGLLDTHLPLALVIGAICVATAPGVVLAIVTELRAGGTFTTALLAVIALSDALAIALFAVAAALAQTLVSPDGVSWCGMSAVVGWELGFSLILGLAAGRLLVIMGKHARRKEALLMVVLGTVLTTSGAASVLRGSPLLACMVVGYVIVNLEKRRPDFFLVVEEVEEPLFGLFFGLAGAQIDLELFRSSAAMVVIILVVRMGGKQLGAWAGARISRAPEAIKKYLALGLFPQAGISIGLVLVARGIFEDTVVAETLLNAIIGTVILNELIAPPLVKHALTKAGEIHRVAL